MNNNKIGRVSVWIAKDWSGLHIFSNEPTITNNGSVDEWYGILSSFDSVIAIRNIVYNLTYGWDVSHEPEKITIKFEIL